nr:NADH dehydrogenase subunit 2 [Nais communis]
MNYSPLSFMLYTTLIMSTLMVATSPNWLTAWILLEINMLSFMPLMTMTKSNQETEAATKYFLAQALGSLMLLMAAVMMYQPGMHSIMLLILLMALLIKLGAAPCHFWYPSVMASLSWSNCMLLSTWQKLAPLFLFKAVMSGNSDFLDNSYMYMIFTIAVMNTTTGGVMGMNQTHLRPLLAYSSIGHMGWMISGLAINKACLSIAYFFMYSSLVVPIFILMMMMNSKTIHTLHSIFKTNNFMPLILMLLLLSLAGLPPLTGFFPKLVMVMWLATSSHVMLLLMLIGSYMNLYYYLSISLSMVMSANNSNLKYYEMPKNLSPMMIGATSTLGMIVLFM